VDVFALAKVKDASVAEHTSSASALFDVVAAPEMEQASNFEFRKVQSCHVLLLVVYYKTSIAEILLLVNQKALFSGLKKCCFFYYNGI
jgi:hypothetical protein